MTKIVSPAVKAKAKAWMFEAKAIKFDVSLVHSIHQVAAPAWSMGEVCCILRHVYRRCLPVCVIQSEFHNCLQKSQMVTSELSTGGSAILVLQLILVLVFILFSSC